MSLERCKKLLVGVLAVGLILGLTNLAQAQPKSGFGGKLGYFVPGDEDVNDIWGGGLAFGLSYLYAFPPYGIDFGAEYFSKEEEVTVFPFTVTQGWRVVPITVTFLYFLPGMAEFSPYVGGGLGYYSARYDLDIEVAGIPFFAAPFEESGIGFHAQGGFTLGKNFFIELKYSMANIENGLEVGAGGFSIYAGARI